VRAGRASGEAGIEADVELTLRTIKLVVSYDGTDFSGFQRQANARSVQQELESALEPIEGKHVTVAGAGRTDAGVHALGQVASIKLSNAIPTADLVHAMNARLPEDVRVLTGDEVAAGFHARFSASGKAYRYRISHTPFISPFERRFAVHISRPLDLAAMRDAARRLVGEHDFSCFQAKSEKVRGSVRTVARSEWSEEPLPEGGRLLLYDIAGSGFLKYMVRNVVGTLVEVGDGHRTPASIDELLASKTRAAAGPTAPPQGLYLVRVDYDAAAPVSSSKRYPRV
jgi:tRNA pseudouridine38-40 synthase